MKPDFLCLPCGVLLCVSVHSLQLSFLFSFLPWMAAKNSDFSTATPCCHTHWQTVNNSLLGLSCFIHSCQYLSLVTWNKNLLESNCPMQFANVFIYMIFFLRMTRELLTSVQATFSLVLSLTLCLIPILLSTLNFKLATDANFHNAIQIQFKETPLL